MATASPPPNSSPSAVPPATRSSNPPPPSSSASSPPPNPPTSSSPSRPNASSPDSSITPPPSQSSTPSPPPASSTADPPPPTQSVTPPASSPPPPQVTSSPPPTSTPPPTQSSPPPPSSTSPPPPPLSSSPPPSENSPPPASPNSPPRPPASSNPPETSPTPPATPSEPPAISSPPPSSVPPPRRSPPPPASTPPESSPSPPPSETPTPRNAPPPTRLTPTPPASEPTPSPSNSTPKASPPSPVIRVSPPPASVNSPSSSPPSAVNNTVPDAPGSSNSTSSGGISAGGMVAIGVAVGIVMLSLVGMAIWCFRKRRREVSRLNGGYVLPSPLSSSPRTDTTASKIHSTVPLIGSGSSGNSVYSPPEPGGLGNSRSFFTYEELLKATDGLSTQNLLGEGGFGSVYKGYLPDGKQIAVKQLKIGGGQGEREFKAEVEIISRIHHRHLVSLVGYCISDNRRLLVYDYVSNNTLHFHLHGEGRPVLDWATRVRIAAGAARGIAYLHEDCIPRIIHRDIKSSNILLDNNFEAKVSDFGLAKLALDANTHVTTRVMGTFGYMAPEYASSGKLTEKSDVFSFGVVLLELITGNKPVDTSRPMGDESLVEWARPLLGHAIDNQHFEALVDPRLENNYIESEMLLMIKAAAACIRHLAAKRPRMGQIVRAFDGLDTSDLSNGMRVGESEVYNTAQKSEELRWFRRMAFGNQNYSTDFFIQGSFDA